MQLVVIYQPPSLVFTVRPSNGSGVPYRRLFITDILNVSSELGGKWVIVTDTVLFPSSSIAPYSFCNNRIQ